MTAREHLVVGRSHLIHGQCVYRHGQRVGARLRELASAARGSQVVAPWDHATQDLPF